MTSRFHPREGESETSFGPNINDTSHPQDGNWKDSLSQNATESKPTPLLRFRS